MGYKGLTLAQGIDAMEARKEALLLRRNEHNKEEVDARIDELDYLLEHIVDDIHELEWLEILA